MNDIKFLEEMYQDLKSLLRNKRLFDLICSKRLGTSNHVIPAILALEWTFTDIILLYRGFAKQFIKNLPEGIICKRHSREAKAIILAVESTDYDTKKIEVTTKDRYVIFHPKGNPVRPENAKWYVKLENYIPLLLPIPR